MRLVYNNLLTKISRALKPVLNGSLCDLTLVQAQFLISRGLVNHGSGLFVPRAREFVGDLDRTFKNRVLTICLMSFVVNVIKN